MSPAVALSSAFVSVLLLASLTTRHEADPAPPVSSALQQDGRPASHERYDVMESRFCADCHPVIYAEHEQSTHGRAYTDAEVRLATARFDLGDCIVCHTPRPIFETGVGQNPRRRHHGLVEGNTCMTCHWRPNYDYASFEGDAQCRDAFHPDVGSVEACASCHRNHGTPYQWEKSPTGRETGRTCMDCHMSEVQRPVAVGGPVKSVKRHIFPGGRSESQVRRAYTYGAGIDGNEALITIVNKGAGHNFPTELKQRSVESLVVVFDLEGNEVARSREVFRDPYKRPYGLSLPVNTQIPGGQSRAHRVPLPVEAGTVETTLFYKLYFPIDDFHPELSRVLESRTLPFSGVTPSQASFEDTVDVVPVTPEGISPEDSSPANLVDYARPPIGTVEIDVPSGDSPEDIAALIELFQFPVPEGNRRARQRLAEIGVKAVPALIATLGSWDNKTYNQAMGVLEKIGTPARPAVEAALDSDALYERIHARELVARMQWRGEAVIDALARALAAPAALDRAGAANALGRLHAREQAELIVPLLADADPDVVREAALALGELGADEAISAIEAALARSYYPETRRDLAVALGRLGSAAGVPELLAGLEIEDDLVRESVFEDFFDVTGVHAGFDPLAPRPDRLAALSRLHGWWAASGGADALLPPDPLRDVFAEAHARELVSKLGGSDLLPMDSDEDREISAELVGMGKYAVRALVSGLKYPSGFASKRAQICSCLGQIADPRAAPALSATLRDPVVSVAAWAAWALEGLGDPATLPALARYEQRLRSLMAKGAVPEPAGPGDRLLAQVARTRLAAGDKGALPTLASLLLSDDLFARQLAFEALQRRFGEDRGYDPEAEDDARREAAARWMD